MCLSVNSVDKDKLIMTEDNSTTGNVRIKQELKQPSTLNRDFLGIVTTSQKQASDFCYKLIGKLHENKYIRTLWHSSKPSHALALLAIAFVGSVYFPPQSKAPKPYSAITSLIYLLTSSLHLGAQFYMTFVSGLTLYFSLPRHAFGDVQKILFPRYFTINSILSAVTLLSFSKLHSHQIWEQRHWIQVTTLSFCFLLELLSRLYIAPQVCNLIDVKRAMEVREPGVGKEIGKVCPGRLMGCPRYMSIHGEFRKKHGLMAMANVISMICTLVHLFCLHQVFASKL